MRLDLLERLEPVCPRCLHGGGAESPVVVANQIELRHGHLWHGILHCSNQACWMEFPVIDGVPILTPDPPQTLRNAQNQILTRSDLPAALSSILGDALGQDSAFDRDRQHISLYAHAHYSDWAGGDLAPLTAITTAGLDGCPSTDAPVLDLGCSVGRGTWEMAAAGTGPVLGVDLNIAMLRLAQTLMVEGRARYPRRRIGLVYDDAEILLPSEAKDADLDFWAVDCLALPFRAGAFGQAGATNLVDCIAAPTNMLHEAARVLAPGAGAFFTTPYDWAENAVEKAAWMGGHSDRGALSGAGEPVLTATLQQAGFDVLSEQHDVPWVLTMHARAQMHYNLHVVTCRRT